MPTIHVHGAGQMPQMQHKTKKQVKKVRCRVPASTANIGPGFDAFSMALEEPHLELTVERVEGGEGVMVDVYGPYSHRVPTDPQRNAAAKALDRLIGISGSGVGLRVVIEASIPVAKGLGSSGAEAAGAVVAGERILEMNLNEGERITIASSAEPGSHADNVVASLLGGFNVIDNSPEGLTYLNIKPPEHIGLVILVPTFEKKSTDEARKILTTSPTLVEYSQALSRASLISAAMALGRMDLLLKLIPLDPFIERARANAGLYGAGYRWEHLLEDKKKLLTEYGVALCISGSGPSRLLVYDVRRGLEEVERAVEYLSERIERLAGGLERIIYTKPTTYGARIIDEH
ncbi:Homoserine kinase [Candidatus Calditenuaceae archaeon HR02]|nr:Homoserine kinase [Candidatus Calditenuaceae archaeon HR02]